MQISLSLRRNNSLIQLNIQSIWKSPHIIHGVLFSLSISLFIIPSIHPSNHPFISLMWSTKTQTHSFYFPAKGQRLSGWKYNLCSASSRLLSSAVFTWFSIMGWASGVGFGRFGYYFLITYALMIAKFQLIVMLQAWVMGVFISFPCRFFGRV